jgi:hypothetical protein
MAKKLPIGIQTFSKIREDDYVYVDQGFQVRANRVKNDLQTPAVICLKRLFKHLNTVIR